MTASGGILPDKSVSDKISLPETYPAEKLEQLYRAIPLEEKTDALLHQYFTALGNFYGCITLSHAYRIFSAQNPQLVSKQDFLAFAEIARHEQEYFFVLGEDALFLDVSETAPWDREIIAPLSLLNVTDDSPYYDIKEGQWEKSPYIPAREKLLRYEQPDVLEETPQIIKMRQFIQSHLPADAEADKADKIVELMHFFLHYMYRDMIDHSLDMLYDEGFRLSTQAELDEFMELFMDFHNNVRTPYHYGHTAQEIWDMLSPEEKLMAPHFLSDDSDENTPVENIMDNTMVFGGLMSRRILAPGLRNRIRPEVAAAERGVKLQIKAPGRNDPCPCGSGKKYKQCCGKNRA